MGSLRPMPPEPQGIIERAVGSEEALPRYCQSNNVLTDADRCDGARSHGLAAYLTRSGQALSKHEHDLFSGLLENLAGALTARRRIGTRY